jgi:hypothetical protein
MEHRARKWFGVRLEERGVPPEIILLGWQSTGLWLVSSQSSHHSMGPPREYRPVDREVTVSAPLKPPPLGSSWAPGSPPPFGNEGAILLNSWGFDRR